MHLSKTMKSARQSRPAEPTQPRPEKPCGAHNPQYAVAEQILNIPGEIGWVFVEDPTHMGMVETGQKANHPSP